ncbi:hypothetical protein QUF72_02820 [Desulfobacterales bacterium HSG2]|nr:hypothetical protein [Desulfobacterales bacterium HSG2]
MTNNACQGEKTSEASGIAMRKFSSYGPVDTELHYYAPRTELIDKTYHQLLGPPEKGGHYITVWVPRQPDKQSHEKQHLLHGLAIVGMRSVLGVENVTGSPFNVQEIRGRLSE